MQHLLPGISEVPRATFDNFVTGRNAHVLSALRSLGQDEQVCVYLWGNPGCGRTHLAHAWADFVVDARQNPALETEEPVIAITHAEAFNDAGQTALFNRYNAAREGGPPLLVTGALPPAQLPLREEVKSRLGWSLVFELHALSDDERHAALQHHASARGMKLEGSLIDYLLTHTRRDMPSLMRLLDALDLASLTQKRALTLPFVRETVQRLQNPELI
jgi:DnaA-homolog protein